MNKKQSHSQMPRKSLHTEREIAISHPQAAARDDLKKSFAGRENKGPGGKSKTLRHGTKQKNRVLNVRPTREGQV